MRRQPFALRSDELLARNIRALLHARRIDDSALAAWCGHKPAWLSKILNGERGIRIKDLGKIADFFGVEVASLFQYGIDPLLERRKSQRRLGVERRTGYDRRQETHSGTKESEDAASRPTAQPALIAAHRLTAIASQMEQLAAHYLARHADAVGDPSTSGHEGDSGIRGTGSAASPRKIS